MISVTANAYTHMHAGHETIRLRLHIHTHIFSCDNIHTHTYIQVMRRFVYASFEGKKEEFELPKQNLEDDVIYPDDPVRKLTPENFNGVF